MDKNSDNLLTRLEAVISAGPDEEKAARLLSGLGAMECDEIIDVIKGHDFPFMGPNTKEKLLVILRKLRERKSQ